MIRSHASTRFLVFGIGFLSALALVSANLHATEKRSVVQGNSLIAGSVSPTEQGGSRPWNIRSRVVDFDVYALRGAGRRVEERPRLELRLFDDLAVSLEVRKFEENGDNRFTVEAVVPRMMGSFATITVMDSVVSGFLSLPGFGEFTIRGENGRLRITHNDPSLMPACGVGPEHGHGLAAADLRRLADEPQPISTAETTIVKLFVVFTPEAAQEAGGAFQLFTDVQNAVATTNAVLNNSLVNVQIKLVWFTGVDYEECNEEDPPIHPDCMALDLTLLAAGAGPFEEVHEFRSTLCADLVMLIVTYGASTGEPAGIARLFGPPPLSATYYTNGFSVVDVNALAGFTFAHELGHNFGAAHDHAQGGGGTFPYAHGHRFNGQSVTLTDPLWITVMSYAPGNRCPHFSNPNVLFDGVPTGIPAGMPFAADVALTITNTAPYVSAFGDMVCLTGVAHVVNPGDSIQAAIDAAQNGDHVVVANGTYNEVIDFKGKSIFVRSQSGNPALAIIDGTGIVGSSVVSFKSGEGPNSVLQGFTIRNGFATRGGGLFIEGSDPTISDCWVVDNEALLTGGGAFLYDSEATLAMCRFIDNSTENLGGGLFAQHGAPRIYDSVFQGNQAGVSGKGYGGGIYLWESAAVIQSSRIGVDDPDAPAAAERNLAGIFGGGIYIRNDEEDEDDWILPDLQSTEVCGNIPNNVALPWNDLGNNTICALDFDILVPADYPTIQAAIDVAGNGDIIVVSPGTYNERIDLKGKEIHLRSVDPTDDAIVAATVIHGQGLGTTVRCISGETTSTIIDGFTITGGAATLHGGGIRIQSSSPTIDNCVIVGNTATSSGGGMYASLSAARVRNTHFLNNFAQSSGGGMAIQNSNALSVQDCVFEENHTNHLGGGVATQASAQTMVNVAFLNNTANQWGGGLYNGSNGTPVLIGATFIGNSALLGGGIYTAADGISVTGVAQSDFCDNTPSNTHGPFGNLGGNSLLEFCPPLNNSPQNATPINKAIDTIVGSFTGATRNSTSSCDPTGVDVFYTYSVTDGPVTLAFDTCGSSVNTAIAVFNSGGTELACNVDCVGGPCNAPASCLTMHAVPNGQYLIRISRIPSMVAGGPGPDGYVLHYQEAATIIDLNNDGVVDVSDLLILLGAWGPCLNCPADYNGDGTVDVSDLLLLLANWG